MLVNMQRGSSGLRMQRNCASVSKPASCRGRLHIVAQQRNNPGPLSNVMQHVTALTQRYDFMSTGMGAMVVTSYFVAKGQDPYTALSITFCSTIAALVIGEIMYSNETH